MRNPASSVVAEIYLQAHETTAITTLSNPPNIWKRYVDEVFAIIKRSHLDEFQQHINGLHPNIELTVEQN